MTDKSACKYWDCGWCYAPNYLKTNAINSTCVNPYECPISPLSEPVQYETPMTEIEELKAQIKVLEAKLSLLEEMEKYKSPVEEAYKDWWGQYPELETDGDFDVTRWHGFQAGYEFAWAIAHAKKVVEKVQEEQEDTVWKSVALRFGEKLSDVGPDGYYELSPDAWFRWAVFTYGKNQQVKELVKESVKWCEENPEKSVEDYLQRGERVHKEVEELSTKIHDGYDVVEYQSTDTEMLEFLLNQFQAYSLKMNGESDWVFVNSGFPMNRAKGRSARDAVITAMEAK